MNKQLKFLFLILPILLLQSCSTDSRQSIMEGLLPFITHLLIIAGIIFMIGYTFQMIIDEDDSEESFIRSIAIALSFLIYYASIALDISISDLIVQSTETTKPITVAIANFISPLIFGVITAYFVNRIFRNKNVIATRILIMLSTLIILLFVDTYVASYSVETNTKLLPNVSFVIGLMLYIILGYKND